jgi:uncharacterized protein
VPTNEDMMNILVCPACRSDVKDQIDKIVCLSCGRSYPVTGGIPVMLMDAAAGHKPVRQAL